MRSTQDPQSLNTFKIYPIRFPDSPHTSPLTPPPPPPPRQRRLTLFRLSEELKKKKKSVQRKAGVVGEQLTSATSFQGRLVDFFGRVSKAAPPMSNPLSNSLAPSGGKIQDFFGLNVEDGTNNEILDYNVDDVVKPVLIVLVNSMMQDDPTHHHLRFLHPTFLSLLSSTLFYPMAGGKRGRQEKGSSSKSNPDLRFLNAEDQAAYTRYKSVGITVSKSINPETLSYPEEDLPGEVPDPVPAPVPLCQHSQIDQLVERFDAFETRFDTFEAQQQQFQTRVYEYMAQQQQQHAQDRTWLAEQFDTLLRFHPPPPPPPPDDDDPFTF
ncbi:hypothetical protein M5K25_010801 [Dendrobium thyrsiflorum]|uniref:Uncharacterized protein n=1 Tax=Dendrobium thyrsiflorum TaxID=117978 RepID=A0ABD0V1E6_DENTH